jgi:hypothetical protein
MKYLEAYALCARYTLRDPADYRVWMRYPWTALREDTLYMYATDGVWAIRVPVDDCDAVGACLSPDYGPADVKSYAPAKLDHIFDLSGYTDDDTLRKAWNAAEWDLHGLVTPAKRGVYGDKRRIVVTFAPGSEGFALTVTGQERAGISVDARRLLHIGPVMLVHGSFEPPINAKHVHLTLPESGARVVLCRCV